MRAILTLVAVVFTVTALSSCGEEAGLYDGPPPVKLYGVENASITYTYSGAGEGTKTHILANYGMYQKLEDNMTYSFNGQPRKIHQLDITSDTAQYSVDLKEMKGTKRSFDTTRLNALIKDFTDEERADFQAAYILRGGGKLVGEETILGKPCSIYEVGFSAIRVSLWNGITLNMTAVMGEDTIRMTATEIDLDFTPTVAMFTPPEGVTWEQPRVISNMPAGHPPVDGAPTEGGRMEQSGQSTDNELPAGHPPVD